MREIVVKAERKYSVLVGARWSTEKRSIESAHKKVLYIIPESLRNVINLGQLEHTYFTPDAELQKDVGTLHALWQHSGEIGLRRDDAIVAIGGGATTDLGGFVAATWLRGIAFYSVPTSIAGAVDAAIGGKTGINSAAGKNTIGSFYSPTKVIIDLDFFQSMSERDFNAGMAEVIKCGFISEPKIFNYLNDARGNIEELIYLAVKVKSKVVSKDFKEGKFREILNYGHTLGHAIEKLEGYKLRHGEAISIGLVFAAELSQICLGLSQDEVQKHRDLLTKFNLPISYRRDALPELLECMQGDKKVRGGKVRFIGIRKAGKVGWLEDVTAAQIKSAYERISS